MITKAFVPINFFQYELIRLAQRQIQILDNSEHLAHYLFVQFCIGGISHVLLLYGRVYKGCIMMLTITLVIIHTDTFCKYEFYSFFTYPFAKMDEFRGIARKKGNKFLQAAKVLKISIFHFPVRQQTHLKFCVDV